MLLASEHPESPNGQSGHELPLEVIFRCVQDDSAASLIAQLAAESGLSLAATQILVARKIVSLDEVRRYLSPNFKEQLPHPQEIKNLDAAAELLFEFIDSGEQIVIYSDFDVDGISSGSQLLLYLRALGAKVDIYVPNRFTEGYGLVLSAVETLARRGTKLLITVDCGISSHVELAAAKRFGMKSIVIDHHIPSGNPQQLPPADVVVDPAQDGCPFQSHKLAAAGLVWMFLVLLRIRAEVRYAREVETGKLKIPDPKDFLDLAALGTICDMVPLLGVNRLLAMRGLEALERTARPGLVALKRVAGVAETKRFNAGHVGFALGPRINAAGRLAEGQEVVTLLTTTDTIRAKKIAELLNRLNDQRKQIEEQVKEDCFARVRAEPQILSRSAIVLFGESYHPGVIGIVAQRLVEKFHRPAAVLAPGEMTIGNKKVLVLKGSVRSVSGFHVAEALQSLQPMLVSGGGHAEAGGFSVLPEKFTEFREGFIAFADRVIPLDALRRRCVVDLKLCFSDLHLPLAQELQRFSPFGIGNPSPLFFTSDAKVDSVTSLGNAHLKVRLSDGTGSVTAVAWGFQGNPRLKKGEKVNIAYQVEVNSYQGVLSLQISLREVF